MLIQICTMTMMMTRFHSIWTYSKDGPTFDLFGNNLRHELGMDNDENNVQVRK
jgi:hypothetical protein